MRQICALLSLLLAAAPSGPALADAQGANLRITVENLKNQKGQVIIAVFASKEDYLKKPIGEAAVEIGDDLTGETEFTDLPAGTYAVAAYHDKNGNGDLDTFLVVPREDYGFSNNARSPFGPPSFKSAALELADAEDLHITIRAK